MSAPRSLADDLRRRDDDALARLLRRRPDLLHTVPVDFTALTSRATAGPSVSRCLDSLDALELHVLRTAAESTVDDGLPASDIVKRASTELPADAAPACQEALATLIDCALLWGHPEKLRAVSSVLDLVVAVETPLWPPPDAADADAHDLEQVDRQAGLRARETLALMRDLLDEWSAKPPGVLRTGGLSLRDFAGARALLHADWSRTALTIEVALAARLVADDEEESPSWVPTEQFDRWLALDPAEAWVELVTAWRAMPRLPSLAGEKTKLLVTDNDRRPVPGMRLGILQLLAELPEGSSLTPERILTILDQRRPRQAGVLRRQAVDATMREADELGITAFGALSTAGRLLICEPATNARDRRTLLAQVSEAMSAAMPADVDHVLIQADLTVVAPGPLSPTISRTLGLMADIESRGHATVYRVSDSSVRRALDAGWDAEGLHQFLEQTSRTPIPQPLTYLVNDVARRHGAVRVGTAMSYLRCDAADTLAAMLEDRKLRDLGLQRIADTVLVSPAPTSEVIEVLRASGYAPAAEAPGGGIVIRRPEDRRIPTPRVRPVSAVRAPEEALVTAAVRTIRAGDRASGPRGDLTAGPATAAGVPRLQTNAIVSTLRAAITGSHSVWMGYADTDGSVTEQIVDPIRLSGGMLTAFDHRTDGVRSFAVSRITGTADLP